MLVLLGCTKSDVLMHTFFYFFLVPRAVLQFFYTGMVCKPQTVCCVSLKRLGMLGLRQ